jgi:hypothetical protein
VSVIVDLRFTRRETNYKGWTVGLKVAKIATQRPTAWTITMLDFNDFFYFVQVVDRGGFTAAGRTLRIRSRIYPPCRLRAVLAMGFYFGLRLRQFG